MQSIFISTRSDQIIDPNKPTVWVSGCVLGHKVRFDGGHKNQNFVSKRLAETVNLVPFCPETESGLGLPRESIKLVQIDGKTGAFGNKTKNNHTEALVQWGKKFLDEQKNTPVNGIILKKGSPSCGLERVRIYPHQDKGAMPERNGRGLFAQQLTDQFPNLAYTEEGWLNDTNLKERFLVHVFTDFRFQKAAQSEDAQTLLNFHASHKFLFMAYDPLGQKRLGRILSRAGITPWNELIETYQAEMGRVFSRFPNRGRYSNALQHMAGYLKDILPRTYRQEMANAILQYANNAVGLETPLSLIRHHALNPKAPQYLKDQFYLFPYPVSQLCGQVGIR